MAETKSKTCRKVTKVRHDDMHIAIEPNYRGMFPSDEANVSDFRQWAAAMTARLRDQRSFDEVSIRTVIPRYEACSVCGQPWEEWYYEESPEGPAGLGCANCGAMIETETRKDG